MKTLAELVQGPCEKNQHELLEKGFLGVAREVLALEIPDGTLPATSWRAQQLKYFCLVAVSALLEGEGQGVATKLLSQSLPPALLERIFASVWAFALRSPASEEHHLYFNQYGSSPKRHFVLEVGFLAFFLWRRAQEYRLSLFALKSRWLQ